MTVGSALSLLLAIFKAIPILKGWFDELAAAYVQHEIDAFNEAVREGIRKAVVDHDQRALETTIGSPRAGLPSGQAGSETVDSLPGVPK
jgi:hypothetical protein